MAISRKPTVVVNPVANAYAGPGERIVEFSNNVPTDLQGGLMSLTVTDTGELRVHLYRMDPKVTVTVEQSPAAHAIVTREWNI